MSRDKINVLSIEFDKVYLVQKKRIELGWMDRELSFLLGYRALFVQDVENPNKLLRYDPTDTNQLRRIFYNCNLSDIMSPKIAERYYKLDIVTEEVQLPSERGEDNRKADGRRKSKTFSFQIDILDKDMNPTHFHSFTQDKDDFKIDFTEFVSAKVIEEHIDKLFEGNFFDTPRIAFEVFEHCVKKHGPKIRPCHVAYAIGKYTGRRKAPRLVKDRNKMRREIYEKEN